jgi:hypothetical protein
MIWFAMSQSRTHAVPGSLRSSLNLEARQVIPFARAGSVVAAYHGSANRSTASAIAGAMSCDGLVFNRSRGSRRSERERWHFRGNGSVLECGRFDLDVRKLGGTLNSKDRGRDSFFDFDMSRGSASVADLPSFGRFGSVRVNELPDSTIVREDIIFLDFVLTYWKGFQKWRTFSSEAFILNSLVNVR